MTTISWSSFVLVALVWVLVISKVRETYTCRTTDAVVLSTSPLSLASTWTDQRSRTHSSRVGCKSHCCAHGHRHRSGGRVKSRVSFTQVCEFVWACLETATKAEGAAGKTGRRRSRPRQSQFGIVRKMQYFLHVWDFVLVDFFGSSMTHGFYCVLSTVWGGADAESCTPGCRATRARQPRACGDTIFRKMITEMRGADLIFRIIYIRFLNQYKPQCKKFLRGTFFTTKANASTPTLTQPTTQRRHH